MNGAAFGRAVEAGADAILKGIERLPPRLLGAALGVGIGYVGWIVATTDIGDSYQSPEELEALVYYGQQDLPAPATAVADTPPASSPIKTAAAPSNTSAR